MGQIYGMLHISIKLFFQKLDPETNKIIHMCSENYYKIRERFHETEVVLYDSLN